MAAHLPREDWKNERRPRSTDRPAPSNERRNRTTERPSHQPDQRSRSNHHRERRPAEWQYSCGLCQEDHALNTCQRFRELTPYQRYEAVERRGYCRNCLARSHLAPDCPCLVGCRRCDRRHHTQLHGAPQLEDSLQRATRTMPLINWALVFIPTAMVRIAADGADRWATMRALLSQSSTMSRIATATFKRLGLRSFLHEGTRFTNIKIMSRHTRSTWALKVNAMITDELPRRPYTDPIIEDPTGDFTHSTLADVDPRCNTPIDIELGADVYPAISQDGAVFSGIGDVYAYQTTLGYVFAGATRNLR